MDSARWFFVLERVGVYCPGEEASPLLCGAHGPPARGEGGDAEMTDQDWLVGRLETGTVSQEEKDV